MGGGDLRRLVVTAGAGLVGREILLLRPALGDAQAALDHAEMHRVIPGLDGVGRVRVEVDPLVGEERGVGREDAILPAERDQLVGQLLVHPVEVDLVDDEADAADRPEPLDEVVRRPAPRAREIGLDLDRLPIAADLAAELDRRPAGLTIAPDPDDLAALEEVGDVAGIGPVDVDPAQLDRDPREHGPGHLAIEGPDVLLEILVGPDVLARPAVPAAQAVEETGVDVEADAEREDAGPDLVGVPGDLGDLHLARLARGREAVGEEDHVVGPRVVLEHPQRGLERVADVGAAALADVAHEPDGLVAARRVVSLEFGLETTRRGRHRRRC